MNNVSKYSNKYKKYAFRKIGKFFGSCAVATVITLSGVAIMTPNVTVYASDTTADGEPDTDGLSDSNAGYEVIIPKGKQYIRNDKIESHEPVLKEKGYNGRSFILPKEGEEGYFFDHPMSELFTKLYDKDNDGNVDDEYKNPEPVDNSHAGETIDGGTVPYRSEINPKYPHVVDSGLTGDSLNAPGVWKYNPDGKYAPSDGVINDQDTIVVARKPITVDENANDNVVKEDGSVVLSYPYRIHVNKGDHIDKKDDVYEVGTKPKVERTPIPFETTYKRDDSVPEGTEEEVTAGVNGEKVTTTTYELNVQTGEVTPNEPTSETTNPVTRVVKKGTQPKVEKTPIPFETTYERDDSVPEGTEEEVTAGKNGETVKTTTYELNVQTGEVTPNEPTSETTNPVTRVVKKGTQPKVEKTPIPFETTYERDDSVPEGTEEEVIAGKNGETVKTTTYELNPTTGEVTPNEPASETTNPVTRVVKRGTQPKVEKTPIPFETRYEEDNSIPEGEEREVTAGVNGETVKTTTYELNPTTGEVTANEPTTKTTDAVTRVVKRGTQPKVEKTPETGTLQPEQPGEGTPENPQPKPGETPETPQPKPGETPETPQPETGINVIPPIPRVIERPGGNTVVEVGVPNKDADTLNIWYTKRNNQSDPKEEIVTKKDKDGTWKIEKAPEGVTVNPSTGIVSIPGNKIQPKTWIDTQTKHETKTSKFVRVMSNISDLPEFKGFTKWIEDKESKNLKDPVEGVYERGEFTGYEWKESILEDNTITHIFTKVSTPTSTPEKPSKAETPAVRTVWRDENGKDLKVPSVDKQEAGEFEGYEFVESHLEGDNVTVHVFRAKKTATNTPNEKTTQPEEKQVAVATVTSDKKEEETLSSPTSEKVELPNTGTVTNGFFTVEVAAILAGLGILIPGVKKKETEE